MEKVLKTIARKILGSCPFPNLNPDKKELIDFACQRLNMQSFADLGGVWNVDGGYTFYAMEQHHIGHAILVDTDLTPPVLEMKIRHSGLKIIEGNFGAPSMPDQVGEVDGVFLFDTLLHQVNPNWNDILRMYAQVSRILLIFNQQYTNLRTTTRLDRKSTRLNSSHPSISYAVFCLKKKRKTSNDINRYDVTNNIRHECKT